MFMMFLYSLCRGRVRERKHGTYGATATCVNLSYVYFRVPDYQWEGGGGRNFNGGSQSILNFEFWNFAVNFEGGISINIFLMVVCEPRTPCLRHCLFHAYMTRLQNVIDISCYVFKLDLVIPVNIIEQSIPTNILETSIISALKPPSCYGH